MKTFIENLYKKLLIILLGMLCFLGGFYASSRNALFTIYLGIGCGLIYIVIYLLFKHSLYRLDSDLKAFKVAAFDLDKLLLETSKNVLVNDDLLLKHGMFTFKGIYNLDVEKAYLVNDKYLIKKYTGGYEVYPSSDGVKNFIGTRIVDEEIPEEGQRFLK